MPIVRYPFEDPGPERLEISWETSRLGGWKNIIIRLDGQEIGTVPGKKELAMGQTFFLPGGSVLGVQLLGAPFVVGLRVLLDGQPLPGSAEEMAEPIGLIKSIDGVVGMLYIYCAVNVVLGLLSVCAPPNFSEYLVWYGITPFSIVCGLAQLGLAFPIRRHVMWALVTAIMVILIDGILGAYLVIQYYPDRDPIWAVYSAATSRIFWLNGLPLILMVQGAIALRKLKQWQPWTL